MRGEPVPAAVWGEMIFHLIGIGIVQAYSLHMFCNDSINAISFQSLSALTNEQGFTFWFSLLS
jgi:hypothetical protein